MKNTKLMTVEVAAKMAKQALGNNFCYLITSGSANLGQALSGWSDLDFIIVVKKADFSTKTKLNKIFTQLEKQYRTKIGGLAVTAGEFNQSKTGVVGTDGKALQAMVEAGLGRQKVICLPQTAGCRRLITLSRDQIKTFSLNEIGRIFSAHRRSILRGNLKDKNTLIQITEKSLRHSIIITKLSVQYFYNLTCFSDKEILEAVKRKFPKNLSNGFERILQIKKSAQENKKSLKNKTKEVDDYLEKLKNYVFEKI